MVGPSIREMHSVGNSSFIILYHMFMETMSVYQRIHKLFYFNRLVCKGSKHQENCPNGGRQCVCIGLVFLACTNIPSSSDSVDHFLDLGTKLY